LRGAATGATGGGGQWAGPLRPESRVLDAPPWIPRCLEYCCTRDVEAFLKKTAIAYRPNPSKKAEFWWYAVAVFFKNASTSRVRVLSIAMRDITMRAITTRAL